MNLESLENAAVRARMNALGWTHWRPFVRACRQPRETQNRLLLDLLRRNRQTAFGREHNFAAIAGYDDFAASVPVQTYESLRPYIERQQETGEPALTAAPPALYAQTSGTTGKPKLIPLLDETLADYKRMQATQSYALFCADRLTPAQRAAVLPRLRCSAERMADLQSLLRIATPSVSDIRPRLRLVTTWTGGSCGIALKAVRKLLPPSVRVADLGYMASEFRGSITVDTDSQTGAPTIQQNFFEFVEREDWDNGRPKFLTIERLKEGGRYYIFVTTSGGHEQKRKSGRLRPLEIAPLQRSAGHAYKQHYVDRGRREIQFKIVALQYAGACSFPFAKFAVSLRDA